jgi:hypothetical protein
MPSIHVQTKILILLFAVFYLLHIFGKTGRRQIDLYDLFMLSAVALVPAFFALFPSATHALTDLMGVAFPFVLLFGILLAVLFVFIHRLTAKVHRLEHDNYLLVQELSLLRQAHQQGAATKKSF